MQLLMDTVLGLVEKIMAATIEYSYVCIQNKNAPHAIRVLEEALELLEVMIIKFFFSGFEDRGPTHDSINVTLCFRVR